MPKIITLVVACCLVGGAALVRSGSDDYRVSMVLPNANNLFEGGSVMRNGYEAGSISSIEVEDGKAKIEVDLDTSYGRLHDGAKAEVVWKAALGERLLQIHDGPEKNAELPDGAMLAGVQAEPVELDKVLAALDAPTRKKLNSLTDRLATTLDGREKQANASLESAGPAVQALGAVLREVGTDGTAIKQLVTQLDNTMTILQRRDRSIAQIVDDLGATTAATVTERQALGETLDRLPDVLDEAENTLGLVPDTVDATVPLLEDLDPATDRLASVSKDLRPLLQDLRPAVAQLRPTLGSLARLLGWTPDLMDTGSKTLPEANKALTSLTPVLDFLRPYTPEVAGWATNWGSAAGNYDANGHYTRFYVQAGLESAIGVGMKGPGVTQNLTPKPGQPVGQPWEDAYGSEMR
ncbi:MlaD family protein [Aeromicrobium terrae]|uniref:MCE family protein n=1 Tax=Aeromicrobium terrae TaxID=2498846 RepID=A0A5C8NFN4_9ACTN|nr:MlaD family protein [Aeromicrobium terrae]TXL60704.1 MCE family protein [Aeromicrobium terrae]